MQHEVTNGRDPICNMKLQMVGTLYVTRDPICNGTLPTLLIKIERQQAQEKALSFALIKSIAETMKKLFQKQTTAINRLSE